MLDRIKQTMMNQAMKIMSDPRVGKFLSDPRVMKALSKGFELHGKIRDHVKNKLDAIAGALGVDNKSQKP